MMAISRILASITQYISEAVMRIFGPNDDAYPVIGIQPFTGEPYNHYIRCVKQNQSRWRSKASIHRLFFTC